MWLLNYCDCTDSMATIELDYLYLFYKAIEFDVSIWLDETIYNHFGGWDVKKIDFLVVTLS